MKSLLCLGLDVLTLFWLVVAWSFFYSLWSVFTLTMQIKLLLPCFLSYLPNSLNIFQFIYLISLHYLLLLLILSFPNSLIGIIRQLRHVISSDFLLKRLSYPGFFLSLTIKYWFFSRVQFLVHWYFHLYVLSLYFYSHICLC